MDKQQNITGSDFSPKFFTPEEGRHWNNLLFRLRCFEEAVCKNIRKIENKITEGQNLPSNSSSSEIDEINALIDGKFEKLENQFKNLKQIVKEEIANLGVDNDLNKAKMKEIENQIENNEVKNEVIFLRSKNMEIEKEQILQIQRLNILEEGMEKVEENLNKNEQKFAQIINKNARAIIDKIESLEAKIEILENGSRTSGFSWNGHGSSATTDQNKNPPKPPDIENAEKAVLEENGEIMTGDPFLNGLLTPVGVYDGNPTVSFSRWAQHFMDALNLIITPLNEAQKLSRLKICLGGRARAELDARVPQATTLQEALNFLQEKFVNGHSRTLARQALSKVKQAPGERVFAFAQRLNDAVRAVMMGYEENTIQQRLLDEFLDRLLPDLQFEVKSSRPEDYTKAFETAEHFELLLGEKRQNYQNNQYVDLAEKVEALAIHRSRETRRLCYYCHKPGHVIADCRNRARNNYKARQYNNYYERSNSQNNYWENSNNYRGENRKNRRYNDKNRGNYREYSPNRDSRSPTRVKFSESRVASPVNFGPRISSPYFLAIFALIALICPTLASNESQKPITCSANLPSSLFKLHEKSIYSHYKLNEILTENAEHSNIPFFNQIWVLTAIFCIIALFVFKWFLMPTLIKYFKFLLNLSFCLIRLIKRLINKRREKRKIEMRHKIKQFEHGPDTEIKVAEIAAGYENKCDDLEHTDNKNKNIQPNRKARKKLVEKNCNIKSPDLRKGESSKEAGKSTKDGTHLAKIRMSTFKSTDTERATTNKNLYQQVNGQVSTVQKGKYWSDKVAGRRLFISSKID
uniref:CCHC-type domain-containing protein n=1 Tax=Meloidogyne hapla TaxID=6305 RepID=A0A1I8AZJ1_MELHA